MATKSERIQQLVQQMKAGAISKSELFTQLSLMQRSKRATGSSSASADGNESDSELSDAYDGAPRATRSSGAFVDDFLAAGPRRAIGEEPDADADVGDAAYAADEDAGAAHSSEYAASGSTPERRAEIIRRLFEEKRRARQHLQTQQHADEPAPSASSHSTVTDGGFWEDSRAVLERMRQRADAQPQPQPGASQQRRPASASASGARVRQTQQVQQTQIQAQTLRPGEAPPRSFMYESRMRRLQEELVRKQMAECTFKPRINSMPPQYSGGGLRQSGLTFEERAQLWQQRTAEETERKRREQAQAELHGCTFAPTLAAQSQPQQRRARAQTPDGRGREAFPGAEQQDQTQQQTQQDAQQQPAFERLFERSKTDRLADLQARARQEAEAELRRVCTFKPKLRPSSASARPRYKQAAAARTAAARDGRDGAESVQSSGARRRMGWDDECTFAPRTNPVPARMAAAQVYLSNDIFTRLSQPRPASPRPQDATNTGSAREPMELDAFLRSADEHEPSQARARAGQRRPASPARSEGGARRQSFDAFLARQQQTELRKQRRREEVLRQTAGPHQPTLCAKSVEMASARAQGSFLERVARTAIRKEHAVVRLKAATADPECTFRPQITRAGAQRPGRSAVELSRGDSLRRETKARLAKLRVEQAEQEELTFAPETNAGAHAQGRLRILSEPDSYIERLQHKSALRSRRQSQAAADQEMKELEECTFQPEIHEAPAFVRRMARSMALSRSASAQTLQLQQQSAGPAATPKPDWR